MSVLMLRSMQVEGDSMGRIRPYGCIRIGTQREPLCIPSSKTS